MNSAFNIHNLNNTGGNSVLGTQQATYGDNQFLQLLTEQLKNQTPFEPVDSESFNTQMASYSNMEEQRELNANMLKLLDFQGVLARTQGLSQGSALLGQTVEFLGEDGTTGADTVSSVFVAESGDVRLRLESGAEIDMRQVLGITAGGGGGGGGNSSGSGTSGGNTNNNAGA